MWFCVKSWCISQVLDRVKTSLEFSFSPTNGCYSKDTAPFLNLMEKDKLRNVLADLTGQRQSENLQHRGKGSLMEKNSHFTNGAVATNYLPINQVSKHSPPLQAEPKAYFFSAIFLQHWGLNPGPHSLHMLGKYFTTQKHPKSRITGLSINT